ncbi:ADP-ribosylation factor protein 3 [Coemansia spiralis]|uniref:ADP-ribosylation factor protein 3 n=2 Tax=Coemansia TaxID=4863 RepID=A0A9W8KZ98_9FUNG|nr:ADP-ribosylation factor family-domain-containing protein [Coemansia spiralis]KAJ1996192.1 ADP-ribosylation factor protein 3 [Coemansia umbellata]KAJ2626051.1 ADP-ribosylation factor protein 3 [Coemansia sp. RSA 1358]KAJ2678595.1 ADP-ribosylation factor protein 3 [Coemansia spiralis]
MFTLVSGAYKYFTRLDEYNVLMLGLDGAGKTALLEKIKHIYTGIPGMPMDKLQPTIGVNIGKVTMKSALVKFMDLGGQKDLRGIWEAYFSDCHAVLFVLDSKHADRLEEAKKVLIELVQAKELEGVPLMVLSNKQDLDDVESLAQIKEMINELADYMYGREVRVMGSSGADGAGVRLAVDWLYNRMVENRIQRPPMASEI